MEYAHLLIDKGQKYPHCDRFRLGFLCQNPDAKVQGRPISLSHDSMHRNWIVDMINFKVLFYHSR